jgi:methyl-accepting chemotaxis protein
MTLTIRKKLYGFALIFIGCGLAIALAARWGLNRTDAAMDAAAIAAEAQRNEMNADMMHDALRADVFAALLADKSKADELKQVQDDVAEHAKGIRTYMTENHKLITDGEALKMLNSVEPLVQEYASQAEKMVASAVKDDAEARSQLPAFVQMFKRLERELDKLSERISEDAKTARASGDAVVERTKTFMSVLMVSILLLMAGCAYLIGNSIARPLARTVVLLKDIAEGEGDLRARLEVRSRDEIGELAKWFNVFVEKIQTTVRAIGHHAQSVAGSAEELTSVSHQMSSNSEETAAQANVVSAASEQVSKSVQTVAAGAEEMSASIKEIAKNTNEAARVAKEAVTVAEQTNQTIAKLGDSSAEIGNVVKVITSIAEQTNLLALNATIEAARAGEAGKGFAVVANEVKELAKQTGQATEDISQKISAIQQDTEGAVTAIQQIGGIINQVNDIANTIASAVEEQSVTTNEMARNVEEAAKGSNEIVQNIGGVAQAAQSTASGATQTQAAAQELGRLASELQAIVGQFKYDKEGVAQGPISGVKKSFPKATPQPSYHSQSPTLHTL